MSGIIIARLLGPEALGVLAFASAYVGIFQSLADLGFGTAHIKRVSEGRDLGQCMGMMWLAKLGGVLVMTIAVLLSFWMGGYRSFTNPTSQTVFYLCVAWLIVRQLTFAPWTTFTAFQKVISKDLPELGTQLLNTVLRIAVLLTGFGIVGLAGADVAQYLVLLFIYLWLLRKVPLRWPTLSLARSYLTFGAPMFVVAIITSVGDRLDRVLLEYFAGTIAVGQYSAGMRFGALLQFLSTAVAGLIFPSMSRAYAGGRAEEAFALGVRAERYLALVLLPLMLAITPLADPLVRLLLGPKYFDSAPVIVFGTISMIFNTLTQPYQQLIGAAQKMAVNIVGHVGYFAMQALALYFFLAHTDAVLPTSLRGAPAAAIATGLASFVGAILWRILATRVVGAHLGKRVWIHLISASALFIPAYSLSSAFNMHALSAAMALSITVVITHLVILRLSGELGTTELTFLLRLVPPLGLNVRIRTAE